MHKIIVTGNGTGVGKTVVSAILTTILKGGYWKPVECDDEEGFDSEIVARLMDPDKHPIYPSAYSLKTPVSPHHAARLENISIDPDRIKLPATDRSLIIETAGGVLVPLSTRMISLDLFSAWQARWIIVSRHYLGSINHTLLTIDALKSRKLSILGIIFNGEPNLDSEEAILQISRLPFLGRLLQEEKITKNIVQQYAKVWQTQISQIIPF